MCLQPSTARRGPAADSVALDPGTQLGGHRLPHATRLAKLIHEFVSGLLSDETSTLPLQIKNIAVRINHPLDRTGIPIYQKAR